MQLMRGNLWQLACPSCEARFDISTGVSDDLHHATQMVCVRCRTLGTVWVQHGSEIPESPRCVSCRERLAPWEGTVAFASTSSRLTGPEYVEGPCPVCGTSLSAAETGLWD